MVEVHDIEDTGEDFADCYDKGQYVLFVANDDPIADNITQSRTQWDHHQIEGKCVMLPNKDSCFPEI